MVPVEFSAFVLALLYFVDKNGGLRIWGRKVFMSWVCFPRP